MALEKEINGFWKTRAFLTTMTLNAAGWEEATVNVEDMSGPLVHMYIHDVPTKWTWLCATPLKTFEMAAQRGHEELEITEAVRGGLALAISRTAEGNPPAAVGELDWEQQLGCLMAMYAGTTQTWELAERFAGGGHFIVLHYRKRGEVNGMLRPFALRYENSAIPAEHLTQRLNQVITIDRVKHPEWLGDS